MKSPIEIHEFAAPARSAPRKGRLKAAELILFARSLGGLLEGGVPLLKALYGLEKAASGKEFKAVLSGVEEDIRKGAGFSDSLGRSQGVPAFFHQSVYAGEVSGRVPMVLGELAKYMNKEEALKRAVREALIYPSFVLAAGFVTLGVLTGYVLPKLRVVYEGFGSELPLITKVILGLANAFLPAALIASAVGSFFIASLKRTGRLDRFFYNAPIIGGFFRGFMRVRFSRLLFLLLESGIPVFEALTVVEKTFETHFLRQDIVTLKKAVATGRGLSDCLESVSWMDPISRMLIVSGEETGRLSAAFGQIANDTETALEARIQLVMKLLEPGLILVIGLTVGFVVIGTVLPIFDMSGLVQ